MQEDTILDPNGRTSAWWNNFVNLRMARKGQTNHPSSVVYYDTCTSCKSAYDDQSARNFSIKQAEHEDTGKFSEPARHFAFHPGHASSSGRFWRSPVHRFFRKTLEAIFNALLRPNLNKQVHSFHFILFSNVIT